jgi:Outer membrane lipoprotein-sorting protein
MRVSLAIAILLFAFGNAGAQAPTAKEIIQKSDEKSRGRTSQGEMTMTVIRPDWSRSVTIKSWEKGNRLTMLLITAPAKDKGQVFLKIGTDMWNWVPSIERMVKVPPSMMLQSWMGSDFTNDDLVKESSIVKDYTHRLMGKDTVRSQLCYRIELIPLPSAAVTWGKVIMWVTVADYLQWKAEFYDEDGALVNVMNASVVKRMGDREIPTRLEIAPVAKRGCKTVIDIRSMAFNLPMEDAFFSQQNMRRLSQSTR